MLIDCPSCARSYHVSRAALGESGRTVICPRCETRWYVEPPAPASTSVDPEPLGPGVGEIQADPGRDRRSESRRPTRIRVARPTRRMLSNASLRPMMAAVACLILAMGVIAKRTEIVRAAPRTAALYAAIGLPVNIRGLEFGDIRATALGDTSRGLAISGTIRNVARARASLPRITFDIRDARGETLSTWTENAPKRMLADNETVAFATQTPGLPSGYKDIVVRFDAPTAMPLPTIGALLHKTR